MLTLLLFEKIYVLMRFALLGAEQELIGFPRTLGIRYHDFRRDRRLHEGLLRRSAVLPPLDFGRCHGCRIDYPHATVTALCRVVLDIPFGIHY
jgi:hypothetical protein